MLDFKDNQTGKTKKETEIDALKDENAQLNLQLIDLWETLINGGII